MSKAIPYIKQRKYGFAVYMRKTLIQKCQDISTAQRVVGVWVAMQKEKGGAA